MSDCNGLKLLTIVFRFLISQGLVVGELGDVPGMTGYFSSLYRVQQYYETLYQEITTTELELD